MPLPSTDHHASLPYVRKDEGRGGVLGYIMSLEMRYNKNVGTSQELIPTFNTFYLIFEAACGFTAVIAIPDNAASVFFSSSRVIASKLAALLSPNVFA